MKINAILLEYGLTTTDVIQAIVGIIGLIGSIVAVVISYKSLKLTRQSIEEANRPVIVLSLRYTYTLSALHEYIVIKNYGNTSGTITDLKFNHSLSVLNDGSPLFSQSVPFTLAPGQSFSTVLRTNAFNKDEKERNIVANITYKDFNRTFNDKFYLNQNLAKDVRLSKTSPSKNATMPTIYARVMEEQFRQNL
ncbi:hypothetical protein ACRCJ1_00230 [Aerococcus sp. L_4]